MAIQTKNRREFHPAVSISSWLVFAIAVEICAPHQLSWLALAAAALVFQRAAGLKFLRLLWKARWLWLALILLHAFTVPGIYLWHGAYSPTLEGLQMGGLRVARLVLLLAALARLLVELTPRQLAGGLYLLASPLDWIKFDRRAFAVRLALTLEQIDRAPRKHDWLEALKSPGKLIESPEEIRLVLPEAGPYDAGLFLAACLMLAVSLA